MDLHGYRYSLDGFDFRLDQDLNDPGKYLLSVKHNGEPVVNLRKEPFIRTFKASARKERVDVFCHRFASNKAYRTSMLVSDAFACC